MRKHHAVLLWILPFVLQSEEALAWGLYTHIYFAQLLIWAIPLADPRFRSAVRRFPELLLAGACLPDMSLFGRHAGTRALDTTHQWSVARKMLLNARDGAERALATGFASHLLTDIIAHNHFVPAHEELWFNTPLVTHAVSEWAMDAHIAPQLFVRPAAVIEHNLETLTHYAVQYFDCDLEQAGRALRYLQRGEYLLRAARLPEAAFRGARLTDKNLLRRFDYYACETAARLTQINRVIAGDAPVWHPEIGCAQTVRNQVRTCTQSQIRHGLPLPQDFF